jgi:transposase
MKQINKPRKLLKKLLSLVRDRPDAAVFFFDEGRFGLRPAVGRCWARKDVRPVATARPGYEVYIAICPTTGESVSLFLPWVNTEMMNIFLEHLKTALGDRDCLLVLDQAGWHIATGLQVPANIEFVLLPPYSPELNPVERLWQWLKRHSLRNRFYNNLESVMDAVQSCMNQATATTLMSLCRCNYLLR